MPRLITRKGIVLSELNRKEEAVEAFEDATRLNPEHADTHYRKGVALLELNRKEEAVEAFGSATRPNPENEGATPQGSSAFCPQSQGGGRGSL